MAEADELAEKGREHLDEGRYDEALSCFEQALLMKSDDPELWNLKGMALRSIGRYEEASECYNRSLEIDPRDKNSS